MDFHGLLCRYQKFYFPNANPGEEFRVEFLRMVPYRLAFPSGRDVFVAFHSCGFRGNVRRAFSKASGWKDIQSYSILPP